MPASMIVPPRTTNVRGQPRRIGIEIEFHGPSPSAAAALVAKLFGGRIVTLDSWRCRVENTRFRDFTVELDSSLAHPAAPEAPGLGGKIRAGVATVAGEVIGLVTPTEICAPPVPVPRLPELQALVDALREAGASGTRASPLYGFALQLNPEIAEASADYLTRHLKAYLLLSDWLRGEIRVDPARRLLPFVDPFPQRYVFKVVSPDYHPDLGTLIDDYVADNPTRNRELDMLPVLADLDGGRVARNLADRSVKVKARPAFHYRLPNSLVDDPGWGGLIEEWNRWVRVEELAASPDRLADTGRAYLAFHRGDPLSDWAERLRALTA